MYPDSEQKRRRQQKLLIGAMALFAVVIVTISLLTSHNKPPATKKTGPGTNTVKYDANSGETVRTIDGEHGNTGVSNDAPLYLGTDELLNAGLTTDQLTNLETAFYRYSATNSLHIKQVSITTGSAQTRIINPNTENEITAIDFTVVFDSKTKVSATVQYSGFESVELILHDSSGAQIYDSGVIDESSTTGD